MSNIEITRTPSAYAYPLLIGQLLEEGVQRAPEQEIVYGAQRYRYRELQQRVTRLAAGLAALGVTPGQTVAVMDWDSVRYLECYFAVPMMGAVLHMVNVRLSPEQILYTINHAEDDVLLVNSEFLPLLAGIYSQITRPIKLILLNDEANAPSSDLPIISDYEALLANADPTRYTFPSLAENTRATTFYTTGTTGLPKGVYFSHRQLVLHTLAVRTALGAGKHSLLDEGDVYMPITPMFHVHAWGMPFIATSLGVKQVYPGRYLPERLLQLVQQERVTFSHCVPTILQMLLNHPLSAEVDLRGWKLIIGGSAMPRPLALAALERGIDVITGYGMSETCPILTLAQLERSMQQLPLEEQAELRCYTGRSVPMVQLRIVDEMGNDVAHDGRSVGEVVVRTPWLTQGYLKDPQASAQLWAGGWLHTGDIGVMNEQGWLRITDRLKDVIKTGGEWLSSPELEGMLLSSPMLLEAAVIGVRDTKWGERPLAIVVLKPGYQPEEAEADIRQRLADFVARGVLPRYGIPERIEFVSELVKTSVGKLNKKAMRTQFTE